MAMTSTDFAAAKTSLKSLSTVPLGRGFHFTVDPMDTFLIHLQVEPLLEQAGALLDRCLVDRNESRNYEVELWRLRNDLEDFFELHQISLEEMQVGTDRQAVHAFTAEKNANKELAIGYEAAAAELEALLTTVDELTDHAKQVKFRGLQALLSRMPYDKETYEKVNPTGLVIDYGSGPVNATLSDHASMLAGEFARRENVTRRANTRAQWTVNLRSAAASNIRAATAETQLELALDEVKLRRQRTITTGTQAIARLEILDQPGHALNYRARIEAVRLRFEQDLRDAWARILAASLGLQQLFAYTAPLPAHDDLDGLILWLRDAMSWLSTFQRRDQNYVASVSVRRTLGEKGWTSGLGSGRWRLPISQTLSPGEFYVRLRGVGATVEGADGLWNLTIRAPRNAEITHADTSVVILDQNLLGSVRLGRVAKRTDRPVDIGGVNMLHNASPFGTWELTLAEASTTGAQRAEVQDIVLDLFIAARIP